jgi:hypothetical protein
MMQDNTVYADALEAHLFCLEAELEARKDYSMNRDFILECSVLRKRIELVTAELNQVKSGS